MSKTLTVSDETYELIKPQLGEEEKYDISELKDFVGKKLFIRTVTYHIIGKVEKIVGHFFVMSEASWIASSGRFMQFLQDGTIDEVEPCGDCYVNINSITDIFPWTHPLPKEQK